MIIGHGLEHHARRNLVPYGIGRLDAGFIGNDCRTLPRPFIDANAEQLQRQRRDLLNIAGAGGGRPIERIKGGKQGLAGRGRQHHWLPRAPITKDTDR